MAQSNNVSVEDESKQGDELEMASAASDSKSSVSHLVSSPVVE